MRLRLAFQAVGVLTTTLLSLGALGVGRQSRVCVTTPSRSKGGQNALPATTIWVGVGSKAEWRSRGVLKT
jgi:hypothetical protein